MRYSSNSHRQREAYVGRLTRTILNEFADIGVDASQDRFTGVMRFRNRSLDGAAIALSVAPSSEVHNSTDNVGVLYFVLPPDVKHLHQDWVHLVPYIRITRKKMFPVFGSVTGIGLKVKGDLFGDLVDWLERDVQLADLLMANVESWRLISVVPILVGSRTWPPGALAISGSSLSAPAREVFECYDLIGRHLRRSLDLLSRRAYTQRGG